MAESVNEWVERLPGLSNEVVVAWIMDVSGRGLNRGQMEEYMNERFALKDSKDSGAGDSFKAKWNLDPATGEKLNLIKPVEVPVPVKPKRVAIKKPEPPVKSPEIAEEPQKATIKRAEVAPSAEEEVTGDEEELDYEEEIYDDDDKADEEEGGARAMKTPDDDEEKPDIPFQNPDLNQMQTGHKEPEPEPAPRFPRRERAPLRTEQLRFSEAREGDFITKRIGREEYEETLKPFRPFQQLIRSEPGTVVKLAQMMDTQNLPPYMQLRDIIINNPVKDQNSSTVLVSALDESTPGRTVMRYMPLPQAKEMTRTLAEQAFFEAFLNNSHIIFEKHDERELQLQSLIYMLEMYCEQRQVSPFDVHIPKEKLTEVIREALKGIHEVIKTEVIGQMVEMRSDLKGEMVDVSEVVERNMGRFDMQFSEALERVVRKVKTDIESTNMEDIKRALLFVQNKVSAAYTSGGTATAVISIMCNDLARRLINENFKLDMIKEMRRYSIDEIQKCLSYKTTSAIIKAMPRLYKNKLIVVYQDGTFSLSK